MKILIADDDELVLRLLEENLQAEGFETVICRDGETAIHMAQSEMPDLIILDIMMPKIDGFHASRILQSIGIPIIMLTGKADISDKLIGLESGADDYIVKPFDSRELVARIKAILRRMEKVKVTGFVKPQDYSIGIYIKEDAKEVFIDGTEISLTPTEYNLIFIFYKNPNRVFEREYLIEKVWDYDFLGDSRTVDMHIQRLRKKLDRWGACIETVFGLGYRFKEKWK